MTAAPGYATPIRRVGQPSDIAEPVLWLASDASAYVSGHALVVDGGLRSGSLRRSRPASREDVFALLRAAAAERD